MEVTELSFGAAQPIAGYGPDFFRIGPHILRGPSLISATAAVSWGGLEDHATLLALAGEVDVVLIGMGRDVAHPPRALREALEAAGLGVEPMSSPSACRTYNVLLSEGRRIAAALLPVGAGI